MPARHNVTILSIVDVLSLSSLINAIGNVPCKAKGGVLISANCWLTLHASKTPLLHSMHHCIHNTFYMMKKKTAGVRISKNDYEYTIWGRKTDHWSWKMMQSKGYLPNIDYNTPQFYFLFLCSSDD